jgi:hypothetical protein
MLVQQVPDDLEFFGVHDVAQRARRPVRNTRVLMGAE